jgi:cell filamentation protein
MEKRTDKYGVNDPCVDQKHGVLKNRLGITNQAQLELAEKEALHRAFKQSAINYAENHRFTASDICDLHQLFLGKIYTWAGTYRQIDLVSPEIRWCHARYIGSEMNRLNVVLEKQTPFHPDLTHDDLLNRLAEIHGELILIHPFRDGNGRVTRLLSDLLLMQAEHPPAHWRRISEGSELVKYYSAIQHVWKKEDYSQLVRIFADLIPVK